MSRTVFLRLAVACLTALAGLLPTSAFALPAEPIAGMVRRSVPFLEKEGAAWIEQRKCVSCHQVPSMLWSLRKASEASFDVNREKLVEWSTWSQGWQNWNGADSQGSEAKAIAGNSATIAGLLLARAPQKTPDEAAIERLRAQLLQSQKDDGQWSAGGQLPLGKRPDRETHEVNTMWAMLALKTSDKVPDDSYRKAAAWLASARPGQSTEWWVLQSLVQREWGDKTLVKDRLTTLSAAQNANGGWGWLMARESDAFGTGLALYALARAGTPPTDPAIQKALAFLQATQRPDGSWPVPGTRARDNEQIKPTSVYWGTAWAVIGMLESADMPL